MSNPIPPSTVALFAALIAAQGEVRTAAKTGRNKFHSYDYSTLGDVLAAAKPALATHGLALMLTNSTTSTDDRGSVTLTSTYRVLHKDGGECPITTDVPVIPDKGRPLDKALFAARTESRTYALLDLLQIDRGEVDVSGREDAAPLPPPPDPATQREAFLARSISQIKSPKGVAKAREAVVKVQLPEDAKRRLADQIDKRALWLASQPRPATSIAAGYADQLAQAVSQEEAIAVALQASTDNRLTTDEKVRVAELGRARLAVLPSRQGTLDQAMAGQDIYED